MTIFYPTQRVRVVANENAMIWFWLPFDPVGKEATIIGRAPESEDYDWEIRIDGASVTVGCDSRHIEPILIPGIESEQSETIEEPETVNA